MGNPIDDLKSALSKVAAITRQLAQREYPYDLERLNIALQAIFEGRFDAVGWQFPSAVIAAKCGYTVVEGQDVAPGTFDITKLVPRQFVPADKWLNGEELRNFARENGGNLGLVDGVRMLGDDRGKKIPASFQGSYIPLPGTLLRDSYDAFFLACLYCYGGGWGLSFLRLDDYWDGSGRLACSESGT